MSFPAAAYITNNARTEGENKTALGDWLAMCKQTPGAGQAEQALTLATDTITPASGAGGIIAVDSEAAASPIIWPPSRRRMCRTARYSSFASPTRRTSSPSNIWRVGRGRSRCGPAQIS